MILKGVVEQIYFRNDENSYTVAEVKVNKESVICVGKFPIVCEGECLELVGNFTKHSKYGEQFSATSVKITPPNTLDGIIKYLSSGLIKGVGPVTAYNIVEKFKENTLDVIEFNPDKLVSVKGISAKKAEDISSSFRDLKKLQNAVIFMQGYDISTNLAIRIFNFYGEKSEQQLKDNPYELVETVDGIGFLTADKIAVKMGIKLDSIFRFRAGILHILKDYCDKSGNTLIFKTNLREMLINLLNVETAIVDENFENLLTKLEIDSQIKTFDYEKDTAIMLLKYYNTEKIVALMLHQISACFSDLNIDILQDIEFFESLNSIKMHEKQKEAVSMAINSGVSIITGGPGTGKTTIIKCIIDIFTKLNKKVQLMAPTGRASKRLSDSTGRDAQTIHRALEVDYSNYNLFKYNNLNKLPYDVVIVDEVSMVDVQLM